MKKGIFFLTLLAAAIFTVSCRKDDEGTNVKLRDYQTQYNSDLLDIETFLKTHSYTEVIAPGTPEDGDVTFTAVPEGSPDAIWAELGNKLKPRTVEDDGITYTLYYLKLREGGGADPSNLKPKPCNVDGVLAAYTGKYLFHLTGTDDAGVAYDSLKNFEFEVNKFPQAIFNLDEVIKGWSEIFPQFRGGDANQVAGQPTVYTDFGAGVMFIPSGLGYYQQGSAAVPSYSPLVFTFKLFDINRRDHDNDGIPSYLEDIGGPDGATTPDGYLYILFDSSGNPLPNVDDSDGDGTPDYLDIDDDGDRMLTRIELLFDAANQDSEPFTFETVPDCAGNTTSPTRLRRYRDPSCAGSRP